MGYPGQPPTIGDNRDSQPGARPLYSREPRGDRGPIALKSSLATSPPGRHGGRVVGIAKSYVRIQAMPTVGVASLNVPRTESLRLWYFGGIFGGTRYELCNINLFMNAYETMWVPLPHTLFIAVHICLSPSVHNRKPLKILNALSIVIWTFPRVSDLTGVKAGAFSNVPARRAGLSPRSALNGDPPQAKRHRDQERQTKGKRLAAERWGRPLPGRYGRRLETMALVLRIQWQRKTSFLWSLSIRYPR